MITLFKCAPWQTLQYLCWGSQSEKVSTNCKRSLMSIIFLDVFIIFIVYYTNLVWNSDWIIVSKICVDVNRPYAYFVIQASTTSASGFKVATNAFLSYCELHPSVMDYGKSKNAEQGLVQFIDCWLDVEMWELHSKREISLSFHWKIGLWHFE